MASAVVTGVASTERAPSVLPAAGEPCLAEASSTLDESSSTSRNEPSFKELQQRFDSLLLEGAALLNMSADELASGGDECEGYETLEEAFAALGMDAGAYAIEQSLVGLKVDDPATSKTSHMAGPAPAAIGIGLSDGNEAAAVQTTVARRDGAPTAVAQPSKSAHAAAVRMQAAVRGHLVRLGFAEACAIYFGASSPPNAQGATSPANVCFSRIHGGVPGGLHAYDFACCARAALAIPLTLTEALAIFPHPFNNSPGRAAASSVVLGSRQASGCIDVTEQERKRIKGAAGRRAAAAVAATKLRLAREAAIEAKSRVSMFRGELYLNHSRALKDAEDADDVHATPKADAQGVCAALRVCWLHPISRKEAVQAAFEPFGAIKHVQICLGEKWMHPPEITVPFVDYYNYAIVTYRDKSSAVAARDAMNCASVTFDKRVRAEALTVSFASGKTDHTGDESDDEFDDALGLTCPNDPESDGLESGDDLDDFY